MMYICLKIALLEYTERILETNDWATYLLVLCFLLMAIAKYFYPRRFSDFIMLPLNNKFFTVHGKEDSIRHPFNIIFFAIQVSCAGLFINLLINNFSGNATHNPWLLLQICSGYGIFVLAKFSVEKIVGNIFSIDGIIDNYLYQKLGYRNFLSLLLFCGVLFFLYVLPNQTQVLLLYGVIILALNVVALVYTYRKNSILIASNFFYFILYLCALEISPYIIFYKFFMTESSF